MPFPKPKRIPCCCSKMAGNHLAHSFSIVFLSPARKFKMPMAASMSFLTHVIIQWSLAGVLVTLGSSHCQSQQMRFRRSPLSSLLPHQQLHVVLGSWVTRFKQRLEAWPHRFPAALLGMCSGKNWLQITVLLPCLFWLSLLFSIIHFYLFERQK